MKTFWIIVAGACGLAAVFFVVTEDYEKAFVAATGGAVCWLLNYRQQIKESLPPDEDDEEEDEQEESDEEVRS